MKTKNYDIKMLDKEEDIVNELSKIDNRGLNILYSRTLVNLRLGAYSYVLPYDTVFTSNRNELILLLNEMYSEAFKYVLDEKNINYHEVVFQEETYEYKKPQKNKEIVFARGLQTLKKALKESKKQGNKECIYYPNIKGKLKLRYYLRDTSDESIYESKIKENIFDINTKGLIELKDKIILLLDQNEERNITYKQALKMLKDMHMNVSISDETSYESIKRDKEFIKK